MRLRAACVLMLLVTACHKDNGSTTTAPPGDGRADQPPAPQRPPGPAPAAPRPTAAVVFDTPAGPLKVWSEVVSRRDDVRRGLMFREHLPEDQGMLFLMREEKVQTFYMRNTLIPLDMIFIGRDKVVVGVVENAVPLDETSRDVGKPSLYVLEVNGGWTRKHGVGAGTRATFENVAE